MILSTQWNDLVKNAKVQWREGYGMVPVAARAFYDVYGVSEKTSEHSQIDPPGFAKRKNEGAKYPIGSPIQGYSLTLSQTRIGLMDEVTWEMRKFDKYNQIMKKMRGLGESTAQRMELDCTHQLTFGMSAASYTNMDGETIATTTGDGQNLFDTDHTITSASGSYANLITTVFGRAGLEAAENLIPTWVNNNGIKIVTSMDTIFTTDDPTLCNNVREFLASEKVPDNAENAVNVYKGKYNHVVLPYLATDNAGARNTSIVNYWGLLNKSHTDGIMEVSEYPTFTAAQPNSNSEDFETDGWKMKSSACYDLGWLDWKCLIGSTGAVSA